MPWNLTLGMRILLHIAEYDRGLEGFDIPPQLTQLGIAQTLAVRQSDVSRSLARLKADGHVLERSSSVGPGRAGRKQRLKVYSLSGSGRDVAHSLSNSILDMEVSVPPRSAGETARRVPLKEVNAILGTTHSAARLAGMVAPDGTLVVAPPARPAPMERAPPVPEESFYDRGRELALLLQKAREGPEALVSVVGIAGVGKTALARKLVCGLADRTAFYFQVREWPCFGLFLQGLRDLLAARGRRRLAALLQRPGSPPTDEAAAAATRDMEGLGAVLVLDDFHHASGQPELSHFVRQLLDTAAQGAPPRIIVFGSNAPGLYDLREISLEGKVWEMRLEGLDEQGSRDFAASLGIPQAAIGTAVTAAHGHPLSIRLLRGLPGAPLAVGDALRFLQEEVIGGIPPGERSLLQLLSVLRRPEDQPTVLALSDDPLAFDALAALVSRSLVTMADGRYMVHEMVREGAYGRLPLGARRDMHQRAAAHYLKAASTESGVEAVHHLCRAQDDERAAQILLSLGGELIAEGHLEECRSLLDELDAARTSQAAGMRRLRQDLLSEYGDWDMGFEYLYQCGLLARVTGLKIKNPGRGIRTEKEWKAAMEDHRRGLRVLEKVGDTAGRCELLASLGWVRLMRGEWKEAGDAYRAAARQSSRSECQKQALRAQMGLGELAMLRGNNGEAARRFKNVQDSLGKEDTGLQIACLNHRALLAASESEQKAAVEMLGSALALCGTGRHRRERAYTLLHLGQTLSRLGDREGARRNLGTAASEFWGIGDQHGTVFALLAMAAGALDAGDSSGARALAAEAMREPVTGQLEAIRGHAAWMAARPAKGGAER